MRAPARYDLYVQLQMVCAGHDVKTAIEALSDSLASSIAFAAESADNAEEIVNGLVPDILKTIHENWERRVRAASLLSANSGSQM